ncbi:MAG: PHP domain-containing protein [Candidatus Poribacteria bacterium]|nr:PHP domain-containing protein [Candidatus Poribacteria bacterium]
MFHCDYHIHTKLSPCAARDFDIEKIIQIQQEQGMKEIGITDHDYGYGYKAKNIEAVRKVIKKCEPSISVHVGVESHILEYRVASINIQLASYFDYVLMAPNHYHLRGVSLPSDPGNPRKVANHEIYMFEAAVACPLTDVVVHPFVVMPNVFRMSKEEVAAFGQEMMRAIDQKRLIRQLDLAAQRGIGIEISPKFIRYNQMHLVEFYHLCLEREVKLLIGSDAHNAEELGELSKLEPVLKELGVQEEHLWRPKEWRW